MKTDRLLGITIYLLNHGRTSAQALARRFEVSSRTIARDIDALGLAGIPVVSVQGSDGGYEILETFRMERQIAGQIDYAYIVAALQGLSTAYSSTELDALLEKMRACRANGEATPLLLDFGVVRENARVNEKLRALHAAIQARRRVAFDYTNAAGIVRRRFVEPAATLYRWYNWYLLAWLPEKESYCAFKLVRMGELRVVDQACSRAHDPEQALREWEASDVRPVVSVQLRCAPELRSRCEEYLNGEVVECCDDGSFVYRFSAPEDEQFWYGVVLSFADRATVLEPEWLAARICAGCRAVLKHYGQGEQ